MAELDGIPNFLSKNQRARLTEPIPDSLVFFDQGNNKYVNHMVVVDKLNEVFNHSWCWNIIDKGIEESKAFTNKSGQTSAASYYIWVLGELRYPVMDPFSKNVIWVTKQAFGGKVVVGNGKVQSQAFKSASSDALKKAASLIGIAPNVYMRNDVFEALDESDSDTWTPNKVSIYAKETDRVREIKEAMGEDEFNKLVETFCQESDNYTQYGKVTPSNIEAFLAYCASKKNNAQPKESVPAKPVEKKGLPVFKL